jgi:hypothetical protein
MKWFFSLFIVLVTLPLVSAAAYPGFADPLFSVNNHVVSASDDAVYKFGWYSISGADWVSFELSGTVLGGDWLSDGTITLPAFGDGEHYVILYSCSNTGIWDCHGSLL